LIKFRLIATRGKIKDFISGLDPSEVKSRIKKLEKEGFTFEVEKYEQNKKGNF